MYEIFLLFFVFIASSLNAEVLFYAADSFEKKEIKNCMVAFYAEQLMQAGLFEEEEVAKEAAIMEVHSEQLEDDKKLFYFYLALEDTRIGYLVYSIKDQTAYLDAIYFEEKYQGKGLGKQVLQHFEAVLENEVQVLKLYVFDHNKRAVGLYNKIGYEIETTYYINDKPIGHHMKKII